MVSSGGGLHASSERSERVVRSVVSVLIRVPITIDSRFAQDAHEGGSTLTRQRA
jgi:hypothetical protein